MTGVDLKTVLCLIKAQELKPDHIHENEVRLEFLCHAYSFDAVSCRGRVKSVFAKCLPHDMHFSW